MNRVTKLTSLALLLFVGFGQTNKTDVQSSEKSADQTNIRQSAEHGVATAQYLLALRCLATQTNQASSSEAAEWMQKAADQNLPDAEFSLGLMFDQGRGVPQDKLRAGRMILKAAEHGLPAAQHAAGNMYLQGLNGVSTNFAESAKWFRKGADQGYADSQEEIGSLFAKGLGVRQDLSEAAKWWEKAATNGNQTAAFNLGAAYFRGDGVPRDASKAFRWTKKAADQGYPMAQLTIGRFYLEGWGTQKDLIEALKWLSIGMQSPSTPRQFSSIPEDGPLGRAAKALIERCKSEMTPEQIKTAEEAMETAMKRQ